ESSGGNGAQNSSSDVPVVELLGVGNEATLYLSCTNWQSNSFVSLPVTQFPVGYALATLFVNGTPSTSSIVRIASTQNFSTCRPAPAGLVSWWPGAGNASDISGHHYNGTLVNGATFAQGEVGQAFFFDGVDDRVLVQGFCNSIPTNEISIEFWQNVSS